MQKMLPACCLCFLLALFPASSSAQFPVPAPPPPSSFALDSGDLTNALDRNVQAVANLTASNERTVDKLQKTVTDIVESNDKNVDEIVRATDRLRPSLDGLGDTAQDILHAWEDSMKPSLDRATDMGGNAVASIADINHLGRDALKKWDDSLKPTVDGILSTWDNSMAPKVDDALGKMDKALDLVADTISFAKTTIFPVVVVAVTVWVAMCMVAAVMCCVIKRKLLAPSKKDAAAPVPSDFGDVVVGSTKTKMESVFRGACIARCV